MKTILSRGCCIAFGIILAIPYGAAFAADKNGLPISTFENTEVYQTLPRWQGFYYGVTLGYGWGESRHNYDRNNNHGLATKDLDGVTASLTLGYNQMVAPNFLIGLEGDLGIMDLDSNDSVIFDGHVWKSQFGSFWGTLRGRAGFVWDRALIYGTGGLAFMDVDEVGYGDAAGQTAENKDFHTGWVVGGGVEYALTDAITGKIEYLHMDFGRTSGLSENQETFYFENEVDIVRTGLNFKF